MRSHPSAALLDGKVVIVTGAGRGLGKAMARVFSRDGAKVLAVDISGEESAVASELGDSVVAYNADLRREADIEAMVAVARSRFGRLDGLVNNAATLASRKGEVSAEEYDEMTAVNLRAVVLCCKYAIREMTAGGGGSIVNVTSAGALNTEERSPITYAAAKAGVHSLTKSLAVHHGLQGVRVNAIAPGFCRTEKTMFASEETLRANAAKAALGRVGDSEEQAQAAMFLLSDRASFITGAIIPVDGGWSARLA